MFWPPLVVVQYTLSLDVAGYTVGVATSSFVSLLSNRLTRKQLSNVATLSQACFFDFADFFDFFVKFLEERSPGDVTYSDPNVKPSKDAITADVKCIFRLKKVSSG